MTGQCSICLNPYRDPISIPCGHIYCLGCLNAYANAPAHEGLKASCPTCRQEFYFVTPDVRILPSKFHPFIMNHMRRVYITPSEGQQELVQQNEQLRAQVDNLKSQEEELLARNDRLKRQRDSCKRKERENAQERQQLERELAQVRRELEDARLVYTQASNAAERFRDYNAHQEEELCQLSELVDRLAHERDEADELARAAAQENAVRARAQRALEERFNRCMQE
ncbi:hypothetical protein CC1G_00785 [Coprinopsis cinerea okayama7|uniref:RING-type domain-containing protein n=1 Tax=Coprinopsis cinerea (strain Okayama-7 / 130 / ATCC MYA-4618 / FGSC 9003) TaxID=240176 RepID=A8N8R0_COPC7|nr:hypothetical protein CC1G_00785 [Coprinopsis cinerea okayama7\|eukprot:XP_001831238.1 hypothetical protein CC1G_00785 [Coprinopsis cinerea okayama7\